VFKPLAALGVLNAVVLFCLTEMVVPETTARFNSIYLQEVNKVSAVATVERNIWKKRDRAIYKIDRYDPVNQVMFGFTAYHVDDQFRLVKRLDSRRGEFVGNRWVLRDTLSQDIDPETGGSHVVFHEQLTVSLDLKPEVLKQVAKNSEEMNYRDLSAFIQQVEAEGDDATRYRVDLYNKAAFPVVCLVMCLFGTGIAFKRRLKDSLPVMVTCGIAVAFLYWVVMSFCRSLGYGEILPPVVAAWATNLIFLCAGGLILINEAKA
jgi:lipopolysaccharide export system permease protein